MQTVPYIPLRKKLLQWLLHFAVIPSNCHLLPYR